MSSIVGHQRILKTSSFDHPYMDGYSKSSDNKISYDVQNVFTVLSIVRVNAFPAVLHCWHSFRTKSRMAKWLQVES